ncbi:MAG: hypothetical protein ACNA8N_13470 [Trueperaceae bacterium]
MPRLCPPGKFRRALDLLDRDLPGGIRELEGLARTYAKDPEVRAALGVAYVDDERPFEALPHLEWAERKEPTPALQDALFATYLALDMPQHALRLAARSGRQPRERGRDEAARPEPDAAEDKNLPTQDQLTFERARIGLLQGDPKAATAMERLLAKHPDYQPARNLLVTHQLLRGDIGRYGELAADAFALAPGDPHALLNATRAAFIQGGVEAARTLRPNADALEPDPSWGGDRYLARAEALALMGDATATEVALGAYRHWEQTSGDDTQADAAYEIDALLERRRGDPRAPLVDLSELIVGLMMRWQRGGMERIQQDVEANLAGMPGLLRELPDWIGYQSPGIVRLLGTALLLPGASAPAEGSWATVFERVARHGPGTREARHALLLVLAETGHIDDDEAVVLDGDDEDEASVRLQRFEISGEAVPTGLPAEDEARMIAALEDMARGRVAPALAALSALHERHPDSVPLTYNLAVVERHSGGDAVRRGNERLRRLADRHPDYLFARVDLALMAIEAGDLEEAESLLALPEGKRRFHAHEWGVYVVACGRLALARGDVDAAERFLDDIADTLGHDAPSYGALAAALDDFGDGHDVTDDDDDDDVALPEAPDLDELAALPALDERWCIALRPAAFMMGEDPEPTLTWVGAVATDDGLVRHAHFEAEPFDADSLFALFAVACAGGMVAAEPGRPRLVILEDGDDDEYEDLAVGLAERLAALGVDVVQGGVEPALTAVRGLGEALGGGAPAWLADAEEEDVFDYFDAVLAFYDAAPWRRFESDRFLAFRVGDGPWRYANVMGQAGQEYGIAVYPGWHEANAYVEDPGETEDPAEERLAAIGWLEGLSLTEFAALSPLDGGRYLESGMDPDPDGEVPAWLRFEPDGPGVPEHGPGVVAVLIDLLAEHARRAKHRVRRFDVIASTPAGRMRVVYPAVGEDPGLAARAPRGRE